MRVSVALCTCNGRAFIKEQIESILNQTSSVDEIVLCDDESTDGTVQLAETVLQNSAVPYKIIQNRPRLGVGQNFVKSIQECTGDIVLLSDQDDIWLANKVAALIEAFQNPEIVLAFSDAYIIDDRGEITKESLAEYMLGEYADKAWGVYLPDTMARVQKTPNGCLMGIRRKDFLPYLEPLPYDWHDGWIMHVAALIGEYHYIPQKLVSYRIHRDNLTSSAKAKQEYIAKVNAGNEVDRHFFLHQFRRARIDLFRMIVASAKKKNEWNRYIQSYNDSIWVWDQLSSVNGKKTWGRVKTIFKILLSGKFQYRYIDPVLPKGFNFLCRICKVFVVDVLFLVRVNQK